MTQYLETIRVQDPRTNFDANVQAVYMVGGKNVNYNVLAFPSPQIGSTIQCNSNVASGLGLLRNQFYHITGSFSLQVTNNGAGSTALSPGAFGLASNPFYKLVSNINLTLNNVNLQWNNVRQTIDLMTLQKRSFWVDHTYFSGCCQLQDNAINYDVLFNTNKNVLGFWYSNGFAVDIEPRTTRLNITSNPATAPNATGTVTGTYDVFAPVCIGPFTCTNDQKKALVRINNFQHQINLINDATQFFSVNAEYNSIASVNSFLISSATLLYQTIELRGENVDQLMAYDSYTWQYNIQPIASLPTGSTAVNILEITYSTQPEWIMIAVRPSANSKTCDDCSYYMPVVNCALNYNDNNVLVANGVGMDKMLYDMSIRNGLNMDYAQWSGADISAGLSATSPLALGGGPLLVTPKDLQSAKNIYEASGVSGSWLLSSSNFVVNNVTGATVNNCELVILALLPQVFYETSAGSYIQTNIVPNPNSITTVESPMKAEELANSDMSGSGLKDFLRSAAKFAKKALPYVQKGAEIGLSVADKIDGGIVLGGASDRMRKIRGGNLRDKL